MLQRIKPYLMLLPALLLMILLFWGGLYFGFLQSLGLMEPSGASKFTLYFYRSLFTSSEFINSLLLTLRTALISTLLSCLLSVIILGLLFILEENRIIGQLKRIIYLPMMLPHITAAYIITLLFMNSGWLSGLAYNLGIIRSMNGFPSIINDSRGIGIILTYLWKEIPFLILMLTPVVQRIQDNWISIAKVLGADRRNFFKEVVLPLLKPTLISSSLIIFAFTFTDFEVPYILGITYPKFVSVFAWDVYYNGDIAMRPLALAANFVLSFITIILGFITYRLSKKWSVEKEIRW